MSVQLQGPSITTTVLVAADEPLARGGLRRMLEGAPGITVTAEAACGEDALTAARRLRPDVIVLDARPTGCRTAESTATLVRALARLGEDGKPRVVALTSDGPGSATAALIHAGASSVISPEAPRDHYAAAVGATAAGHVWVDPLLARTLLDELAWGRTDDGPRARALERLTCREREVLALLAEGHSNAEIADRVSVTVGTVKTHVSRILGKLGLTRRAQAVALANRVGPGATATR